MKIGLPCCSDANAPNETKISHDPGVAQRVRKQPMCRARIVGCIAWLGVAFWLSSCGVTELGNAVCGLSSGQIRVSGYVHKPKHVDNKVVGWSDVLFRLKMLGTLNLHLTDSAPSIKARLDSEQSKLSLPLVSSGKPLGNDGKKTGSASGNNGGENGGGGSIEWHEWAQIMGVWVLFYGIGAIGTQLLLIKFNKL